VRPQRSYQLAKDVRELMLVLAFTAISFLAGAERSVVQRGLLAAVVLMVGSALIWWRLRTRLRP